MILKRFYIPTNELKKKNTSFQSFTNTSAPLQLCKNKLAKMMSASVFINRRFHRGHFKD